MVQASKSYVDWQKRSLALPKEIDPDDFSIPINEWPPNKMLQ
jgi:hypothetical protein